MNTLELIQDLEDELASIKDRLTDLKHLVWADTNRLEASEERLWMLEQLADPDNDGRPYSDKLGA